MKITLSCPCLFGLEKVLSGEIKRMGGAEDINVTDGRVTFSGDISLIARANINLRTAERVQILMGKFKARTFEELFQGVKSLPFEDIIGPHDAFPVKGWSLNSQLHSIPDCQSIVKKAVVDRLSDVYGISWFRETGNKYQIQFAIRKDSVLILIDTSGQGLHKRGYRKDANEAPIKETLAAGMLDLIRVYPDDVIFDPFCGSGTFVIEAAMHALRIAPGLRRAFAAERWELLPKDVWHQQRQEAFENIRRDAPFKAYGYDIDPSAVELAEHNAKLAGVEERVKIKLQDIADFNVDCERGKVICNPPYGERMLEIKEAETIYKTMGEVFSKNPTLSYNIISPHEKFEDIFGRVADKRRKLYNGMIKCQFFMYNSVNFGKNR